MHEASLCQGLLNLVLETVESHNATHPASSQIHRVHGLVCELGVYSCIDPTTLASCFELFAENTLAEGAELTIRRAPLTYECQGCGHTFVETTRQFHCPACGCDNIHFDGGHGLMLVSLRVDTEE